LSDDAAASGSSSAFGFDAAAIAPLADAETKATPVPKQKAARNNKRGAEGGTGPKPKRGRCAPKSSEPLQSASETTAIVQTPASETTLAVAAGRPKRVLISVIQKWLEQDLFKSTIAAKAIWGKEFPTTKRWMGRQATDFQKHIDALTDVEEHDKCVLTMKPFQAASKILHLYHNLDERLEDSDQMLAAYEAAQKFLALPPKATNFFPAWFRKNIYKRSVSKTEDHKSFWTAISAENLESSGVEQVEMTDSMIEFIANRILKFMQGQRETPNQTLVDFVLNTNMEETMDDKIRESLDKIMGVVTMEGQRFCKVVIQPQPVDVEEFSESSCPLIQAFLTYPCGKSSLKNYKRIQRKRAGVEQNIDAAHELIANIKKALEESDDTQAVMDMLPPIEKAVEGLPQQCADAQMSFEKSRLPSHLFAVVEMCSEYLSSAFKNFMAPYLTIAPPWSHEPSPLALNAKIENVKINPENVKELKTIRRCKALGSPWLCENHWKCI
jgi:hypothetical protein